MFVVLALMPVFILIVNALSGAFVGGAGLSMPIGQITLSDGVLTVPPDTWSDVLLSPLGLENTGTGLVSTSLAFVEYLQDYAGLPVNLYTIFALFYFVYLFVLFGLELIFDFLTFVPRKCKEIIQ